jgi:hypothetical protein
MTLQKLGQGNLGHKEIQHNWDPSEPRNIGNLVLYLHWVHGIANISWTVTGFVLTLAPWDFLQYKEQFCLLPSCPRSQGKYLQHVCLPPPHQWYLPIKLSSSSVKELTGTNALAFWAYNTTKSLTNSPPGDPKECEQTPVRPVRLFSCQHGRGRV